MLSLKIRERLQSSAALSSVTELWGSLQKNICLAGRILLVPIALFIEKFCQRRFPDPKPSPVWSLPKPRGRAAA